MVDVFPEKDTDDTKDGLAAHFVASVILRSWKDAGGVSPLHHASYLGSADPDGTLITNEILDGAEMYALEVAAVCDSVPFGWDALQIEQRVYATEWVHPDNWGTCDAFLYDAHNDTLYIWDFKFGHLDIPAFENLQLVNYYAGIAQGMGLDGHSDQTIKVVMQAVQPRCFTHNGPIKEWRVVGSDLRGLINKLRTGAAAARGPNPMTRSGPQCRYCPARHGCKSARDAAMAGVDYVHRAHPDVLTNDAVSYELATLTDASKAIEYRLEAIQEEAASRISGGQNIPGYRMAVSQGQRKWVKDVDVIRSMGDLLGVSLVAPPKAVTPFQAEKVLKGAGLDNAAIETTLSSLVVRPSSGMKVVQDTGTEARRLFTQSR